MTLAFDLFRQLDGSSNSLDWKGTPIAVPLPDIGAANTFLVAPSNLGLDSREPQGELDRPDIQVSGATQDRSIITVTSSTIDFGAEPTKYLDFTGEGDTAGQLITPVGLNGASVRNITAGALAVDNAPGLSKSWLNAEPGQSYQIQLLLPDVTQIFTSFKYKNNGYWPGATGWPSGSPEPGVLPDDSAWKILWIAADENDVGGTGASNLCIPTYSSGSLSIAGNSHNMVIGMIPDIERMCVFNDWSSIETFIKAGTPLNDPSGIAVMNVTAPNYGRRHETANGAVFAPQHSDTGFRQINIQGWFDDNAFARAWLSDIYIADIPSRLLIGDHPILSKCRYTSVAAHQTWSSNQITAELRVPHDKATNLYLFYIDETGNAVSQIGIPLFGGNL